MKPKVTEFSRTYSVRVGPRRRYRIELTLMKSGTWLAAVTRRDRRQIGVWIPSNKTPNIALEKGLRWIRRSVVKYT